MTLAAALISSAWALSIGTAESAARIYGSKPLNISTAVGGGPANGPSGQPAISGDNRVSRYVAFHSDASNLVLADENARRDVFIWRRPGGAEGVALNRIGVGSISVASVATDGRAANGDSQGPNLDGSMKTSPRCVAFQSRATNLVASDATPDWDVYVRNLRTRRTYLASAGVSADATRPSLAGDCSKVTFDAGRVVWRSFAQNWATGANARRTATRVGAGTQARYSLEGLTITWVGPGKKIKILAKGQRVRTVGSGQRPWASDKDRIAGWGVTYQTPTGTVSKRLTRSWRLRTHARIANSVFGGSTAYVANRGIIVFARNNSLYYYNSNTGNFDDLAHARSRITEMGTGARATLIAFAATGGDNDFIDSSPASGLPTIYVKWLRQTE